MTDALSQCVLEPRSVNDYRVLVATLVLPSYVTVIRLATSPFVGINQSRTEIRPRRIQRLQVYAIDEKRN